MKKLLIANWKMNPAGAKEAEVIANYSDREGVVVCVPFIFLPTIAKTLKKAAIGAQDVFYQNGTGAFTGEISANQLKELGVSYVIVGHSDRRKYFNETDEIVAKKVRALLDANIVPVLCLGETKEERASGKSNQVVERQLKTVLSQLPQEFRKSRLVVAYEPIWAISTNVSADGSEEEAVNRVPDVAGKMLEYMREISKPFGVQIDFIYGGSVSVGNIDDLLKHDEIEGFLVGAESLKKDNFIQMIDLVSS